MEERKMHPGMWRYPTVTNLCCIYRVPHYLREVNPEAYTPQLVLIGPLHHSLKSQALKALDRGDDITNTKSMAYLNMEELKKIYLAEFAEEFGGENIIDRFRTIIEEEEENIRASYSESTAWIQSTEFVEMVLHDSVFIMEFIQRRVRKELRERADRLMYKIGDPLVDNLNLAYVMSYDLLMLENQLPYFIFEKLFDPIVPIIFGNQTLRTLFVIFFAVLGVEVNSKFGHFTDLIRCALVETLPNHDVSKTKRIKLMYNAEKLDIGGVKFKAVGEKLSLDVRFENNCLEMHCLTVEDKLEMKLRNIMALEQCHYPDSAHVCNYIIFLDYLMDTDKDVDLLVEKGIIINSIGEPAAVARMVNKLGHSIIDYGSYYSDIADKVNAYYTNPVNRSKAVLKHMYFGNLWTGTATIAGMLLLVMTLIQTWASVTQVNQNKS